MRIYLSGPMSGLPRFNTSAFAAAAAALRANGFEVVSPHEIDEQDAPLAAAVRASVDGDVTGLPSTWGSLIARDIQIVADGNIDMIAVLPGWEQSKGARLEVLTGLLLRRAIGRIYGGVLRILDPDQVLETLYNSLKETH